MGLFIVVFWALKQKKQALLQKIVLYGKKHLEFFLGVFNELTMHWPFYAVKAKNPILHGTLYCFLTLTSAFKRVINSATLKMGRNLD